MIFQCSCHLFLLNVKMCFVWEDLLLCSLLLVISSPWSEDNRYSYSLNIELNYKMLWWANYKRLNWVMCCSFGNRFYLCFPLFQTNSHEKSAFISFNLITDCCWRSKYYIWHLILDFLLILSNLVCGRYSDNCGTFKTQGMAFICHPIYNILKYE